MTHSIGILLTNTGTPDAPTTRAVRRYLREFLSDKRIVHIPRFIWLPILYGLILPLRARKSAHLYQNIWTQEGSPMRSLMQQLASSLQTKLGDIPVEIGMNYGNPSISQALENLRAQQVEQLIVLPLYPQYSNTTTASSFDRVNAALTKWPSLPEITWIRDYATKPSYIQALALSIREYWHHQGLAEHLLISFHGVPERFIQKGDIYQSHCEQTARLLAEALNLPRDKWTLCYQSQFGYDKWLKPSTQTLFETLPKQGIQQLDVVCPGFAVDCLETLEEIALRGKESFLHAGGKSLRYLPALNQTAYQVDMLQALILSKIAREVGVPKITEAC